jgi:hypothetical protein
VGKRRGNHQEEAGKEFYKYGQAKVSSGEKSRWRLIVSIARSVGSWWAIRSC